MCARRSESEPHAGDAIMDPSSSQIVAATLACGILFEAVGTADSAEPNLGLLLKINATNRRGEAACRLSKSQSPGDRCEVNTFECLLLPLHFFSHCLSSHNQLIIIALHPLYVSRQPDTAIISHDNRRTRKTITTSVTRRHLHVRFLFESHQNQQRGRLPQFQLQIARERDDVVL